MFRKLSVKQPIPDAPIDAREIEPKISEHEPTQETLKKLIPEIDATDKEAKLLIDKFNQEIPILAIKTEEDLKFQPKMLEAKHYLESIFIQKNDSDKTADFKKFVNCLTPPETDDATKTFAENYLAPSLGLARLENIVTSPDDITDEVIEQAADRVGIHLLKEKAHQALFEVIHNKQGRGKDEFYRYFQERDAKAKLQRLAQVIAIGENLRSNQTGEIKKEMRGQGSEKINLDDPKTLNRLAKIFGIKYEVESPKVETLKTV